MTDRTGFAKELLSRSSPLPEAGPKHEPEVRKAIEGEALGRAHPAMLVVCLKSGDEVLLSYALLRRADKREGGRRWELLFDDCVVMFAGRNLGKKVRNMLRHHKLSVLQEGNLVEDELTPEDEAFIEQIEIRERED